MAKETSGKLRSAAKSAVIGGAKYVIENTPDKPKTSSVKKSHGAGIFFIVFILILFLFFLPSSPIAKSIESGYLASTGFGRAIGNIGEGIGGLFRSFGNTFSLLNRAASGEEVFSFEQGNADVQEKTGLSFGGSGIFGGADLTPFGTYTNEEFGIRGDIVVGKLDENIPMLRNVRLLCELDKIAFGRIEMDDIKEVAENVAVFDIQNPKPAPESRIPFHCLFNSDGELDSKLNQKINTKTVKLSLTYPLEISSRLEVFALPEETNNNYRGKYEAAFDELEGGLYRDKSSKILARPKFISDVGLTLWFDNQPLGVGKDFILRYGLENKNTKNKFLIKRFEIELPNGIDFNPLKKCSDFALNGGKGMLKTELYSKINSALNDEATLTGTSFGSCSVKINERILGGADAEIVRAEDIIATLEYEYTTNVEKPVSLRKPVEPVVAEEAKTEQTIS